MEGKRIKQEDGHMSDVVNTFDRPSIPSSPSVTSATRSSQLTRQNTGRDHLPAAVVKVKVKVEDDGWEAGYCNYNVAVVKMPVYEYQSSRSRRRQNYQGVDQERTGRLLVLVKKETKGILKKKVDVTGTSEEDGWSIGMCNYNYCVARKPEYVYQSSRRRHSETFVARSVKKEMVLKQE